MSRDIILLPSVKECAEGNLPYLWMTVVHSLVLDDRHFDILTNRFNLDGHGKLTLEEIASKYGVSRERIRQLESKMMSNLRSFLSKEKNFKGSVVNPDFSTLITEFLFRLDGAGFPLSDNAFQDLLASFYDVDPIQISYMELLMELLGYQSWIYREPFSYKSEYKCWIDNEGDKKRIVEVLDSALRKLMSNSKPVRINKLADLNSFGTYFVRRCLSIIPYVECVNYLFYQVKLTSLLSNVLRVERIMLDWRSEGKLSATIQEIKEKLQDAYAIEGKEVDFGDNVIRNSLVTSELLLPIGRSSTWTLKEGGTCVLKVVDLMEEALQVSDRPLKPKEVFNYVKTFRSVSLNSIHTYISSLDKFKRVGDGLYVLQES